MSKQKDLQVLIDSLNESETFMNTFKLGRRNGNYYVDVYSKDNFYLGAINAGNYIETWYFLRGMRSATWEMKPF